MIKIAPGLILFALLAFAPQTDAAGEVNKCVDDKGKVTYSSRPCPGNTTSETVRIRRAPVADDAVDNAEGNGEAGAPGSLQQLDARIAETDDPVVKAQLQLTRQQCELAKTQLERYDNAPYLMRKNDDGSQTKLSDEEAAAEKAKLRSFLAQECR